MYKKTKKILKHICLFLLIIGQVLNMSFTGVNTYASEVDDYIDEIHVADDDNYIQNMQNIVEPYIDSIKETGYVNGQDGVNLYYEKYTIENPKANIVISHGYTESLEKYNELIYYLLNDGYNVFGIEHRGHGRSGSLGIADKTQIYVKSFDQYIEDFKIFMDEIVVPNSDDKQLFLYAHSMGGAIGTNFLEKYPEYFDAAILNCPMLEVDTGNIPSFLAKIVVKSAVLFGQGGKYVIGKNPYSSEYVFEGAGTTSEVRHRYIYDIVSSNEELQRGEASYNWTNESFKATKEIVKAENAAKVKIPVLLFQAGEDTYVKPGGQNKFAENAGNCTIKRIENGRHELYNERDEIQIPYLKNVLEFYNTNL